MRNLDPDKAGSWRIERDRVAFQEMLPPTHRHDYQRLEADPALCTGIPNAEPLSMDLFSCICRVAVAVLLGVVAALQLALHSKYVQDQYVTLGFRQRRQIKLVVVIM